MANDYTKEDATSFGKVVNKYLSRMKSRDLLNDYLKKSAYISRHIDKLDYNKYIMDLVALLDKYTDPVKEYGAWVSVDKLMHMKLDELPLYINGDGVINELAKWRLKIGK